MRIISFDPATNKFGVAGVSLVDDKLSLYLSYLFESPINWTLDQKTLFMSHACNLMIFVDKPDFVVSEYPWGAGYSLGSMRELTGSMKAEAVQKIEWQGVSEARKAVLGDGYGAERKRPTAEWFTQYPWDLKSKRAIEALLAAANPDTDEGYDVLDAILHALCFLIKKELIAPVHRPEKIKKVKKLTKSDKKTKDI